MRTIAWVAVLIALGACSREPQRTVAASKPVAALAAAPLTGLPVEMTVRQRTTTTVPGSGDALRVTVDDVTRNQVMVSLAPTDGGIVLAPTSLSPGGSAEFAYAGASYVVTLKALKNSLVDTDVATLVFSAAAAVLSEASKIERLLQLVQDQKDATFIRNNSDHSAKDAADHLRRKWRAGGDKIATAEQFIEGIASKSSTSGEPYRIRFADGRVVLAGDWFRERLAEIERPK